MGIAEVIPGVSGGTIAFITGIYERLLDAIKSIRPNLLTVLRREGIRGVWVELDGTFLVTLGVGMIGGIVFALIVVTRLLDDFPVLLWAFFFGLIIASAIYVARQIKQWRPSVLGLFVLGTAIALAVVVITPAGYSDAFQQTPMFLVLVFFAACIAICALILPGVSGSFLLLVMGLYTIVIPALKALITEQDFQHIPLVAVFCAGALTGLLTFSHLVSWAFKRYRDPTLGLLTGFMVGSLLKIWPWRIPLKGVTEEYQPTTDPALMDKVTQDVFASPANWAEKMGEPSHLLLALVCAVVGFALVFGLDWLGSGKDEKPSKSV